MTETKPKKKKRRNDPNAPFILKCDNGMRALPHWLKERKYNTFTFGNTDSRGNPMIGLQWDRDPDNDWSKKWEPRGLIIIVQPSFQDQARTLVEDNCSSGRYEHESE